jgi:hypothetical protein
VSDAADRSPSKPLPAWRIGAGVAVLGAFSWFAVLLVPVYLRNLQLQDFLRETPAASDEMLQQAILNKSHSLGLDITPDHLQIRRTPGGGPTVVRYVIRVTIPLYSVDLHFSSNVGEARR